MTDASNDRFNKEAEAWDLNPFIQQATKSALECILNHAPSLSLESTTKPKVLDLGAGTGLLSLAICPYASTVLAIDPAPGMIQTLSRKLLQKTAPTNITPLCALLESADDPKLPTDPDTGEKFRFDVIISNLVMHHIPQLSEFINLTYSLLSPGGLIVLTDFENTGPEAKKFHPEDKMEGVERHGLVRTDMEEMLEKAGFQDRKVEVGWVMRKQVERFPGELAGGEKPKEVALEKEEEQCMMDFNFLVVTGRR